MVKPAETRSGRPEQSRCAFVQRQLPRCLAAVLRGRLRDRHRPPGELTTFKTAAVMDVILIL